MLQDNQDIEDQWKVFSQAVRECAEETIGRRRGTRKEQWIQDDTWELIDERKSIKIKREQAKIDKERAKYFTKYQELDKKVKNKCRYDKKQWIENKGKEAQEAADKNDIKTLYKIAK